MELSSEFSARMLVPTDVGGWSDGVCCWRLSDDGAVLERRGVARVRSARSIWERSLNVSRGVSSDPWLGVPTLRYRSAQC